MTLLEKEWYIEAPWGRLCVVAWGECSAPPVLVCHGVVDTAATFRPLVNLLPRDFYYIALEWPGNGRSDRYPHGMMVSAYDLVFSIAVVVRHFRWDNFRFVAHSMGVLVGLLYDLSYPGKMTHVVNLDPVTKALTVPADMFADWYHKYFTKYYENYDILNGGRETEPKHQWKDALEKMMKNRHLKEAEAVETLLRMSEPVADGIIRYHKYFTKYYENYDILNGGRETEPKHQWKDALEKMMKNRHLKEAEAVETLLRMSEPVADGIIRYTFDRRMTLVTPPPLSPQNIKRIFTNIPTSTLSILAETSIQKGLYKGTEFMLDESTYPLKNYRVRRVDGTHDVHLISPETVAGYVGQFLLYGVEGLDSKAKL